MKLSDSERPEPKASTSNSHKAGALRQAFASSTTNIARVLVERVVKAGVRCDKADEDIVAKEGGVAKMAPKRKAGPSNGRSAKRVTSRMGTPMSKDSDDEYEHDDSEDWDEEVERDDAPPKYDSQSCSSASAPSPGADSKCM